MVQDNRKIGLGVMGWADMLMKMGVSYNSEEGCKLGKQVMEFIDYHSKVESVELSKNAVNSITLQAQFMIEPIIYMKNIKDNLQGLSLMICGQSLTEKLQITA